MPISIKQLEMLADHFHFSMDEARQVLGIEIKKRGRSPSGTTEITGHYKPNGKADQVAGQYKPKAEKTVKVEKEKKPVKVEKEKKPRGPSGYNVFVREQGVSFRNAGAAWKALSDGERERWNAKAKA